MPIHSPMPAAALPVLLLLAAVSPAAELTQRQGPASLRLQADKVEEGVLVVRLSDLVPAVVRVEGQAALEVELTQPAVASRGWLVRKADAPQRTALPGGRTAWEQKLVLEPRDRGDQPLALAPLRYRTGPDGEWATVNWQPVPARVTTEVVAVDPKEIRPITPPEEVPPARSWPGWLIWAGVALAGLGLLAGGWELRRRLAGGAASPPPEKWAARELDRVAALPLNNEDEVARFHTELSDVVRRYLELRFQLRAPRQTTAEFLESMRDAPQLTGEQQALLRDLLERCDLAKFARAAAPPEECQAAAAMARTFVQQTAAPAKPATSARQGKG